MSGSTPLTSSAPRTSVAAGAATARHSQARKSGKSWMQDHADKPLTDAIQGGVDAEVARNTVKCVTRFATFMCIVIAIVKVAVYVYSKSSVVKTSALDSMGDLVANCITLYTGYRMNKEDTQNFPIGQSTFEPVGVLVFSTLMATAMFTNALSNVEELLEEEEQSREEAIENFFKAMFGERKETEEGLEYENVAENFKSYHDKMKFVFDHNFADLPGKDTGFKMIFAPENDDYEKAWNAINEQGEDESELSLVWQCADAESVLDQRTKLFFTLGFLACCATYKFFLWQYCVRIAIPRSNSTILVALANDKRNDVCSTSFAIACLLIGYFFKEQLGEEIAEMIDPAASLILSCVIIYTWVSLMLPQVGILCSTTVEDDFLQPLCGDVQDTVKSGQGCEVNSVICYKSSSIQNTVEVELNIPEGSTPYSTIAPVVKNLYSKLGDMEDVERVLIIMPRH